VSVRRFQELRDLVEPPERPAVIDTRLEAAAYLRWHAWTLLQLIEQAEGEV
jgi:hypothetical protein